MTYNLLINYVNYFNFMLLPNYDDK